MSRNVTLKVGSPSYMSRNVALFRRRFCFKPPQGPVPPDKDPKLINLLAKTALGVIVVVLGGRIFLMSARGLSVGLMNPYSAGLGLAVSIGLYTAYRGGHLPKYRPWMPRALAVGAIGSIFAAVTIRDIEQSHVQSLRKQSLQALETKGEGNTRLVYRTGESHMNLTNHYCLNVLS